MPWAPRSRQRRASSSGLFVRSSLTYGTSSPPARSAWARVRSFGTLNAGLAVVLVHAEDVRAQEAEAVEQPGQLVVVADHPVDVVPRCVCASKRSAPSGTSVRSVSRYASTIDRARSNEVTGSVYVRVSASLQRRPDARSSHRELAQADAGRSGDRVRDRGRRRDDRRLADALRAERTVRCGNLDDQRVDVGHAVGVAARRSRGTSPTAGVRPRRAAAPRRAPSRCPGRRRRASDPRRAPGFSARPTSCAIA